MKACPYCGEEIRFAAIVCEYCGYEFSNETQDDTASNARSAESPVRSKHEKGLIVLLGLAFLGVIGLLYTQLGHQSSLVVSQSGSAVAGQSPSSQAIAIVPSSDIDVDAGKIVGFDWIVPNSQPNCHLTGHIEVTSGDSKAVRVFVTTADEYKNLVSGRAATTYLSTEKAASVTLDVRVTTPGPMVLSIANTSSGFTGNRVRLRDVKATCI
jgi:uncharacterized membrane protein YvbJ